MTEEQAKKTFERAMKMEQEFGEYFTGEIGQSERMWWCNESVTLWRIFSQLKICRYFPEKNYSLRWFLVQCT
jgi:hypothetical protein